MSLIVLARATNDGNEEKINLRKSAELVEASVDEGDNDKIGDEIVRALNKGVVESCARSDRYGKIWQVEIKKWPFGMGGKSRSEIPEHLHKKLDECIEKSQEIARNACQTVELTEAYLKHNLPNI